MMMVVSMMTTMMSHDGGGGDDEEDEVSLFTFATWPPSCSEPVLWPLLLLSLPFRSSPSPHPLPSPRQLRQAFALATILSRAVILPEVWCGLDRYWAPHAGTLPGSKFKLPFICPADHILDLENGLARTLDKCVGG